MTRLKQQDRYVVQAASSEENLQATEAGPPSWSCCSRLIPSAADHEACNGCEIQDMQYLKECHYVPGWSQQMFAGYNHAGRSAAGNPGKLMPLFEYKAVAPSGETVRGTMEEASVELVVLKLQEAGNIPLQAKEAGAGGFSLGALRMMRRGMSAAKSGIYPANGHLAGCGPAARSFAASLDGTC
jgi:hypothetical protein